MGYQVIEQVLLTGHLLIPALAFLYKPKLFPHVRTYVLFIVCCVIVYAMILLNAHIVDLRLDLELEKFDLNGDGSFTGIEETPQQKEAMSRVVSDTGRNFAPFTGVIFAPFCVGFVLLVIKVVRFARVTVQRLVHRQ